MCIRDRRGLAVVNGTLGEAFGKLYVEKYFPAEAKSKMEDYISYIKKSFKEHINSLDWMSVSYTHLDVYKRQR